MGDTKDRNWILIGILASVLVVCVMLAFAVLLILRGSEAASPTPAPSPIIITATPQGVAPPDDNPPPPDQPTPSDSIEPQPTAPYTRFFPDLAPPSRHLGFGISVAPHLPSRPDLLSQIGMDWVKVYDTIQIADYPDQNVLYRINTDPHNPDGWEAGLYNLGPELLIRGAVAVEIGNEPNLYAEWAGNPDPVAFTDALCRAYRAIKQSAPELIIVSGGLAPAGDVPGAAVDDLRFMRAMLDAGAGACFDVFGYHPYGFNQPPEADPNENPMSFRRTELAYAILVEYGLGDKQVWITEFGWVRDPSEGGLDCGIDPLFVNFEWMKVDRDTQAVYTAHALSYAADNWPWAGPLFLWNLNWNNYEADYEPPCSHLRWYALLDPAGEPLPTFYALRQIVGDGE